MTVEAAVARGSGLDIRNQITRARNGALWGSAVLGLAAAVLLPGAIGDATSGYGILEALAAIPLGVVSHRAWMLQRSLASLGDDDDEGLTEGDEELARLHDLVDLLQTRSAVRSGRTAIAAARQAYDDRRHLYERRGHIDALLSETRTESARTVLTTELETCTRDLANLDAQVEGLVAAVAHLADASESSHTTAPRRVQDATDAVTALAAAIEEIDRGEPRALGGR
jgi:hypothetical protein